MSVNKVILVGRLGKDPEVRHLDNGTVVANFTLATTEKYKDSAGAKAEKTEWHNIVIWRALAEVAGKYLKKGDTIYVEGKLSTKSWDKEGVKRYRTDVVVDSLTMLGKGTGSRPSPATETPESSAPELEIPTTEGATDDLPF